jgi:hypothetical protein
MDVFTQLQQNRRIIQDFSSTVLAGIANPFARLAYLASLRKAGSNLYEHAGLAAVYGQEAMRQALAQCHEELFERILECPLAVQEKDLQAHLGAMSPGSRAAVTNWRKLETYRTLLPVESPDYLKELFCSNMHTMLDNIANVTPTVRTASHKFKQ